MRMKERKFCRMQVVQNLWVKERNSACVRIYHAKWRNNPSSYFTSGYATKALKEMDTRIQIFDMEEMILLLNANLGKDGTQILRGWKVIL